MNDPNDFGVSLTERIKRRKRAAQSSEANEKNNDESNYELNLTVLDIGGYKVKRRVSTNLQIVKESKKI